MVTITALQAPAASETSAAGQGASSAPNDGAAASTKRSDRSARPEARDNDEGTGTEISNEEHDGEDDDNDHYDDNDDNDDKDIVPEVIFTPAQCLFCNILSTSFSTNLTHMHKKHGLFIPTNIDDGTKVLVVDVETIVRYMHLVVFGYQECLSCHTQRQSPHAVQQHMMGKGHCHVDLEGETSEFRDFYEDAEGMFGSGEDGDSDGGGDDLDRNVEGEREDWTISSKKAQRSGASTASIDKGNLRLASGKVLVHRSAPAPKNTHHRPLSLGGSRRSGQRGIEYLLGDLAPESEAQPQPSDTATAEHSPPGQHAPSSPQSSAPQVQVLTRAERRILTNSKSALTVALTKMSVRDRTALAHLTPAERRSTIIGQFKQQERLRTVERKYWSRMEGMGNQVLMKHFKPDVPGPKLG